MKSDAANRSFGRRPIRIRLIKTSLKLNRLDRLKEELNLMQTVCCGMGLWRFTEAKRTQSKRVPMQPKGRGDARFMTLRVHVPSQAGDMGWDWARQVTQNTVEIKLREFVSDFEKKNLMY